MQSDYRHLLDLSLSELLERLAVVAGAIADGSRQLAQARGQELQDRADGWYHSGEDTVRGREKASQFNAVSSIQMKVETEAEMEAYRAEREFLMVLIDIKTKVGVTLV